MKSAMLRILGVFVCELARAEAAHLKQNTFTV